MCDAFEALIRNNKRKTIMQTENAIAHLHHYFSIISFKSDAMSRPYACPVLPVLMYESKFNYFNGFMQFLFFWTNWMCKRVICLLLWMKWLERFIHLHCSIQKNILLLLFICWSEEIILSRFISTFKMWLTLYRMANAHSWSYYNDLMLFRLRFFSVLSC